MTHLTSVDDLTAAISAGGAFDAVVVVTSSLEAIDIPSIQSTVASARTVDAQIGSSCTLLVAPELAGQRLIIAPTGSTTRDYDDVRRFGDAAKQGIRRARDAGAVKPVILVRGVPSESKFANAVAICAVEALGALWEPLEAHDAKVAGLEPIETIGIDADSKTAEWAQAAEAGRRAARDITGTEPERMAPPRMADYCTELFSGTAVKVEVIADPATVKRDYPMLADVARASFEVKRHHPRVIRLTYDPGKATSTLMFAGKGLTYDTGGADIKAGGHMAGMSRDKGGAGAVIGVLQAIAKLQPPGVKVIAEIGAVRNSVGEEAYVSDEILTSHAGVRCRIGNTDAEGRLVLADLLSHLRVAAATETNPKLFSVATLTGHAGRAVGPYSIALDNGPARAAGVANTLSEVGDLWADPFDISRLRREDYDFIAPRSKADDVLQCNSAPSTMTPRGHQFPMAFLAIAAGLDKHGIDSEQPLSFTHIDIGGSGCEGSDWQHGRPTAVPVLALLQAFVVN